MAHTPPTSNTRANFADHQAHVLLGFSDPCHLLIFFSILDANAFASVIGTLADGVTWTDRVLLARQSGTTPLPSAKLAMAFAYRGLMKLAGNSAAMRWLALPRYSTPGQLTPYYGQTNSSSAFAQDCGSRSNACLMDDLNAHLAWTIGSPDRLPDGLFVIAAPSEAEARQAGNALLATLSHVVGVMAEDLGIRANAAGSALPREHFGFPEGRSTVVAALEDDEFGELRVHVPNATQLYAASTLVLDKGEHDSLPEELQGCSFMAFRRLVQDVHGFHLAVKDLAAANQVTESLVAARMCGLTDSGTPLIPPRSHHDDFDYTGDPDGVLCPLSAHVRLANPRNAGNPRPLYRRSVSFGTPSSSTWTNPRAVDGERGLLFMCYQASIERQFEYVSAAWLNSIDGAPVDALLGKRRGMVGARELQLNLPNAKMGQFVHPTGGGYFLAPTRSFLRSLHREPSPL